MARSKRIQSSALSALKQSYAWGIALFVALSAIPLASNRAGWWLLWTMGFCAAALYYYWRSARRSPNTDIRISEYLGLIVIASIVPVYALIQSMPVAQFLPDSLTALYDGPVELQGKAISVLPDASYIAALRYFGYIAFFAIIIEVSNRASRVLLIYRILFTGIFLQALWALLALRVFGDISILGEKTSYQGAATGTFINRNSLATYLGFGLVLGCVLIADLLQRGHGRVSRPLTLLERLGGQGGIILVAMLNIAFALVLTQSRLGTFSAALGVLAAIVMLRAWAKGMTLGFLLKAAGIVVAFAVLAIWLRGEDLLKRLLFVENDNETRMDIYRNVWEMITYRPWTGFGFDAFAVAFQGFRHPPLLGAQTYDLAHNSYLMLWSELGLVVGTLPLLLLAYVVLLLIRKLRHGQDFPLATIGALSVMLMGAVHSLGDFSLEIPTNVYAFITIVALGLGRRSRKIEAPHSEADKARSTSAPIAIGFAKARS